MISLSVNTNMLFSCNCAHSAQDPGVTGIALGTWNAPAETYIINADQEI